MKSSAKNLMLVALVVLMGAGVSTPAHARWYDGRHWHGGHIPHGWIWDPRLRYYVYQPGVVVAPAPVYVAPAPVYVQPAPPPVVYTEPAYVEPAPVLSLGVHIR